MTERHHTIRTRPGMGRGLINHDPRSEQYRAVERIDPAAAALGPVSKHWRRSAAYDQGQTPECVAFTGKGLLNTKPESAKVAFAVRSKYNTETFYHGAQTHDEYAGEDYDGTSGLGLCRYLRSIGLIQSYSWCFGHEDVLLTVSHLGPVGIGIKWENDMFEPDLDGFIHLGGGEAGGHEIEVTGIDVKKEAVILTNSWGTNWGINGRAYLKFTDLGHLLDDEGDAFILDQTHTERTS